MYLKVISYIKNNSKEILAAFVLSFTLFFFAPLSTFIKNAHSVNFNLWDIFSIFLGISLLAFITISLISLLLKPINTILPLLLTAISIGLLIQGNFLNYNLGVLDGHDIDWTAFKIQSWLELLMWVGLFIVFIAFRKPLAKNLITLLICLLIYQASTNLISLVTNPISVENNGRNFVYEREFEFSKSQNVIYIILDTFRSQAFDKVLKKHPEYREDLKDFTFYSDALGGYPTTLPSVPLALTGQYYDNSIPINNFLSKIQNETLPALLKSNGYTIELYSTVASFFGSIYENVSNTIPYSRIKLLALDQYYVTGIRYMPLGIKPYFVDQYYRGQNYTHKDMVDFIAQVGQTWASDRGPVFKMIHLSGSHPPYQLNGDMQMKGKGYIDQSAASLKLVVDMVRELKKKGVFDNSIIIVIGDHGSQHSLEFQGETPSYSSQPLMLIKRTNQHFDKIQVSEERVSISDIPKSIADELKISNNFPGYSVFSPVPANRIRIWNYYNWSHSDWSTAYLPLMYRFEVNGPASKSASYRIIKKYTENVVTDFELPLYHYGDNLLDSYFSDDAIRQFIMTNFSVNHNAKPIGYWASGPEACIPIRVEPTDRVLNLSFAATPFLIKGKLTDQQISVQLDQIPLGSFRKNDNMTVSIPADISKKISADAQIMLCFELPDSVSPKNRGVSDDNRRLGYSFSSIIIK